MTDLHEMFDSAFAVSDFTVTEGHLKLLRRAYVTWNDEPIGIGAPSINTKRPYGNSDEWADMAKILGVSDTGWQDERGNPTTEAEMRFAQLHVETAIALQIALATGEFRAGHYRRDGDYCRWRRTDG